MVEQRRVAVVIPAYRVGASIQQVLGGLPAWVDHIIVVDDGSPDGTADAARASGDPRVTLLRHDVNRGVGAAMATGYRRAIEVGADIVVKMDGDGQMDPAYLPALLAPILAGRADYAKGDRFHHDAELRTMPWLRLAGNLILTFLTKVSSGCWNVFDPQNGYVATTGSILRQIDLDVLDQGYFFENEMLIQLNILSARIADVPIPARYGDEVSSLRPSRILVSFPLRLAWGFWRRVVEKYVVREFSPVAMLLLPGTALLLGGTAFGAYHWIRSVRSGAPATAGTVVLAMLPVVLGFQLVLQALLLDIQNAPPPASPAAAGVPRHAIPLRRRRLGSPEPIGSASPLGRAGAGAPSATRWLLVVWLAWAALLLVPLGVQAYYASIDGVIGAPWRSLGLALGLAAAIAGVALAAGALGRGASVAAVGTVSVAVVGGTALLSGELRGWLGAALVLLLALPPGLLVARLCGRGAPPVLFACALGLAVVSVLAFLASLIRAFSLPLFAGIALGAWAWYRRLGPPAPAGPAAAGGSRLGRDEMAAIGALWAAFAVLMLQASTPEFDFDPFWAHLPLARAIAERRYVAMPEVWWTMVPHAYHMLAGIGHKLAGVMGAKLLHFAFFGLNVGWAVWLGARLYGVRSGLVAGVLFATIPLAMWNGTVGNTDMGATFFTMGGVAALLEFLRTRAGGWLFAAGMLVGTAVGVKYFTGAILAPMALVLVIEEIRQGRPRRLGLDAVLLAAGLAVTAGPWLVRTALLTGNPVFPVFNYYFHSPYWGWQRENMNFDKFGYSWTVANVLMAPLRLTFDSSRFGELAPGAIGAFPLLWLPWLVGRWRSIGREGAYLVLIALGYFVGVFAFAQYLRYLLVSWLVLAVVIGGAVGTADWHGAWRRRLGPLAVGTALFAGLAYSLFAWLAFYPPNAVALDLVVGSIGRRAFLEATVPSVGVFEAVADVVPRGEKILLYAADHTLYATLYAKRYLVPAWAQPINRVFFDPRLSAPEMLSLLRAHQVRYLLVQPNLRHRVLDLGITKPLIETDRATLYEFVERAERGVDR